MKKKLNNQIGIPELLNEDDFPKLTNQAWSTIYDIGEQLRRKGIQDVTIISMLSDVCWAAQKVDTQPRA
jgi:hypothetical protein